MSKNHTKNYLKYKGKTREEIINDLGSDSLKWLNKDILVYTISKSSLIHKERKLYIEFNKYGKADTFLIL